MFNKIIYKTRRFSWILDELEVQQILFLLYPLFDHLDFLIPYMMRWVNRKKEGQLSRYCSGYCKSSFNACPYYIKSTVWENKSYKHIWNDVCYGYSKLSPQQVHFHKSYIFDHSRVCAQTF